MARYICDLCHHLFEVECKGLDALENKYGDGFTLAAQNGREILVSCPLCEYLPEEERYPLLAWAGLPAPRKEDV